MSNYVLTHTGAQIDTILDSVSGKAPSASPELTGVPTAPTATAGTNTTQIATTAFVKNAVDTAIAGVAQMHFETAQTKPTTNIKTDTIYLIPKTNSETNNIYEEWIYVNNSWELIGSTAIDLSNYATLGSPVFTGTITAPKVSITKTVNNMLTATSDSRAAVDNGANTEPRYIPAKWCFSTGEDPVDGNLYTIRIPYAGGTGGVYMSVNGDVDAKYHPVIISGSSKVTTHYAVDTTITVVYEANSTANAVYDLEPTDNTTTDGIIGVFRVMNYYDSGNTNTLMRTYASTKNVELPLVGVTTSTSVTAPTITSSYKAMYGGVPATNANKATINMSTGKITVPGGIDGTASKVAVTDTTPSSATSYYLTYTTGRTTAGETLRANSDLYYYDMGGISYFNVGSGTNQGGITLHSISGKYANIIPISTLSANITLTLPDKSGTIAVTDDLSSYATKASPALTGIPTAPTASSGTNTTQIATTAFVQTEIAAATANLGGIEWEGIEEESS